MSLNKGRDIPVNDQLNNGEVDTRGILFFKDERALAEHTARNDQNINKSGSGVSPILTELGSISPLDALKKTVSRTVEEAKKEEQAEKERRDVEEKRTLLEANKTESLRPERKVKKSSSLLAKCMPYIYDEQGTNFAEEKPDYTLESVEEIIESAEKRADEKIARMYNLKTADVEKIGTKEEKTEEAAEEKPKLRLQETSVKKPVKIGDEAVTAAKLFETAPIPKVTDTLFDDFSGRRTDVVGKENVITAYSAQGGMDLVGEGHTQAIPDLTPEANPDARYEDILSHTRPVNIEDISSSSAKKAPVTFSAVQEREEEIDIQDFKGEKDITRVGSMLKGAAFIAKLRLIATALLTAFCATLLFDAVREELQPITLAVIEAVALALAAFINSNIFIGFKGAFTKDSKIELPLAIAVGLAVVYFVFGIISGSYPYDAAILPLVSILVYDYCAYRKAKAIFGNFKLVAARKPKTALSLISDVSVTSAMARTLISGEILAAGEQETDEIGDFLKHTLSDKALSGKVNIFTAVALVASLVIGVAVGVSSLSLLSGILAAMTVMSLGAAPTLFIADIMPFVSLSDRLHKVRAAVCSKASAEKIEQINAVVVSSKELFPEGRIKLYNMTPLSANPLDETLVQAASVAKAAGSPLFPVFKKILSNDIAMDEADSVKYEDNLGISGWVGDNHILIGNRSLMQAHGVRVPALEVDRKILHKGYFPVYVALDQRACALLVIGYSVDREIERRLARLLDRGVTLLVNNCDPNITEQMLCDYFSFYLDLVKILDHNGVDKYIKATEYKDAVSAHGFHRGDTESFLEIIIGSMRLRTASTVLYIIHLLAAVVCWTMFAVLSLGGAVGFVGAGLCVLCELVAAIISLTAYFVFKI